MKKHNLTWISAVAAMLGASGLGVRAQDAPAPPAPPMPPMSGTDTTTTTTSTSTMTTGTMSGGMANNVDSPSMRAPSNDHPDYSVLISPAYDYQDLKQAEAVGLGDDNIARISIISRMTGVSFREIRDAVERGETFFSLVDQYNLNRRDLDNLTDEKLRIAAFESAYESTGSGWKRTASTEDTQLEAMYARFKQINDTFPATATPSTLVFERGPAPAQTFAQTTETTTTVRATRPAPVETVEMAPPPVARVRTVTHVTTVKHVRRYRRHVARRHQVHHHMPTYMRRGS